MQVCRPYKHLTIPTNGSSVTVDAEFYCNFPKFSDRQVWANSADPAQTAPDQGLHCLPFCLHCLDSLLYGRAT